MIFWLRVSAQVKTSQSFLTWTLMIIVRQMIQKEFGKEVKVEFATDSH